MAREIVLFGLLDVGGERGAGDDECAADGEVRAAAAVDLEVPDVELGRVVVDDRVLDDGVERLEGRWVDLVVGFGDVLGGAEKDGTRNRKSIGASW